MTRDITFHIVADTDPVIRQLRQLHHELNTLGRKHSRGPQPGCGWRHRKGQARR